MSRMTVWFRSDARICGFSIVVPSIVADCDECWDGAGVEVLCVGTITVLKNLTDWDNTIWKKMITLLTSWTSYEPPTSYAENTLSMNAMFWNINNVCTIDTCGLRNESIQTDNTESNIQSIGISTMTHTWNNFGWIGIILSNLTRNWNGINQQLTFLEQKQQPLSSTWLRGQYYGSAQFTSSDKLQPWTLRW